MYAFFARVFGLAADLFYRRRHLSGSLPEHGPLLLVANHPNGLIDPMLIARLAGSRSLRFLAKAPLFRTPLIGQILQLTSALPVYRPKDGHTTDKNSSTFDAVFSALAAGDAVCIFPEGASHNQPSLLPLKTGAARMALGAEASQAFTLGVRIVPVGLIYRDKEIFRSEVATMIGTPIEISPFREVYSTDEARAVEALTEAIDRGIRAVTINLESWEDLPLFEFAERIWRPSEADPLRRLGLLVEGEQRLKAAEPEALAALRRRVLLFRQRLEALGLEVDQLEAFDAPWLALRFATRNLAALIFGLPAALTGAVGYLVPYWIVRLLVWLLRPTRDLAATYKLLGGMLFYPPWHFLLVATIAGSSGVWPAMLTSLLLPFCGLYALRFFPRRRQALQDLWVFFRLATKSRLRARLFAEKSAIAQAIERLSAQLEAQG